VFREDIDLENNGCVEPSPCNWIWDLGWPTAAVDGFDDDSYSAGDGYFSKFETRTSRMQVRSLTSSAKLLIDTDLHTHWSMLQSRNTLLVFSSGQFGHYCTDPSISSTTVNFSPFWLLLPYLTVEMISSGIFFLSVRIRSFRYKVYLNVRSI
jgi:hypothetical protein